MSFQRVEPTCYVCLQELVIDAENDVFACQLCEKALCLTCRVSVGCRCCLCNRESKWVGFSHASFSAVLVASVQGALAALSLERESSRLSALQYLLLFLDGRQNNVVRLLTDFFAQGKVKARENLTLRLLVSAIVGWFRRCVQAEDIAISERELRAMRTFFNGVHDSLARFGIWRETWYGLRRALDFLQSFPRDRCDELECDSDALLNLFCARNQCSAFDTRRRAGGKRFYPDLIQSAVCMLGSEEVCLTLPEAIVLEYAMQFDNAPLKEHSSDIVQWALRALRTRGLLTECLHIGSDEQLCMAAKQSQEHTTLVLQQLRAFYAERFVRQAENYLICRD